METDERLERISPNAAPRPRPTPAVMAMIAGVAIIVMVVAGIFTPVPINVFCFITAGVLLLWVVMIGSAFAVDARRRRTADRPLG